MSRLGGSLLLLLACPAASAHAISMSSGFATVTGNKVEYLVRMPLYELPDPHGLFDHIHFSSGLETGRRTSEECHRDPGSANYLCAANYEFSRPVERLGIECTFYQITVPNHIHVLRAQKDGKTDRAILDSSISSAALAFRPPTAFETVVEQSAAGAFRVWTDRVQLLLLIALAIAARGPRELLYSGFAFIAGECAGTMEILHSGWQPSPRFAEAAAALALAYLAFEIVAFPKSGGRWLLGLIFGAFAGMYFANFIGDSGYRPALVLSGAAIADAVILLVGLLLPRLPLPPRYHALAKRIAGGFLLISGLVWFGARLRG